jgi:hypothetical protein
MILKPARVDGFDDVPVDNLTARQVERNGNLFTTQRSTDMLNQTRRAPEKKKKKKKKEITCTDILPKIH